MTQFSFDTIKEFDEHILKSIQGYDVLNFQILSLAKYFLEDDTNVYDLGCSTGKLLKVMAQAYKSKKVDYFGLEKNGNFAKDFENQEKLHFLPTDLTKDLKITNANIVLSIFTLQFIAPRFRQAIINEIYGGLNKGGAFIWAEKIYNKDSKLQEVFTFQLYDFKRPNFSEKEILDKEFDLRAIMKPMTEEDNFALLKNAGFITYDIFWKQNNFACFIAIK